MSSYEVRWSRTRKQTLIITDPDGTGHEVSATQLGIPRSWKREAGQWLAAEKMRAGQREREAAEG